MPSLSLRDRGTDHLPEGGVATEIIFIFLHGRFVSSLPFINLSIYFYQFGLRDCGLFLDHKIYSK